MPSVPQHHHLRIKDLNLFPIKYIKYTDFKRCSVLSYTYVEYEPEVP